MTDYRAFLRRRMMEDIYDRLSDEDKRTFLQITTSGKYHNEVMHALTELGKKSDKNRHSFSTDLLANIAGNGAWDALVWVCNKVFRKL